MKGYLSYLRARYSAILQYRAAAFAGMMTQVFWGLVKIMILEAFYAASTTPQPMTFTQVVAYVWLGQAFLALLSWNLDRDVLEMFRTGAVSYELLRPLDLYWVWYFRVMAWRTGQALLRSVPLIAFAALVLRLVGLEEIAMTAPPDVSAALLFACSMVLTVLLGCAISSFAQAILMWTVSGIGVQSVLSVLVTIFSGMIIPLPLFPDWMQPFFRMLPFHALVDSPFRIYSGSIAGIEAVSILLQQVGWIVAIVAGGRLLVRRGVKRLVVQGG